MNSPDQPAQTPVAGSTNTLQTSQPRRCSWIFPVMAMFFSVFLGVMGSFVVPALISGFEKVFAVFGSELSAATLVVIYFGKSFGKWLWLTTVVTAVFFCAWLVEPFRKDFADNALNKRVRNKGTGKYAKALILIIFFDIALLVGTIWALYLPIFKIGSRLIS